MGCREIVLHFDKGGFFLIIKQNDGNENNVVMYMFDDQGKIKGNSRLGLIKEQTNNRKP